MAIRAGPVSRVSYRRNTLAAAAARTAGSPAVVRIAGYSPAVVEARTAGHNQAAAHTVGYSPAGEAARIAVHTPAAEEDHTAGHSLGAQDRQEGRIRRARCHSHARSNPAAAVED